MGQGSGCCNGPDSLCGCCEGGLDDQDDGCCYDTCCARVWMDSGMFTMWGAAITFDLAFYANLYARDNDPTKGDVPDYLFNMCYAAFALGFIFITCAIICRGCYSDEAVERGSIHADGSPRAGSPRRGDDDDDDDEDDRGCRDGFWKKALFAFVALDVVFDEGLIAAAAIAYLSDVEFKEDFESAFISIAVIIIPILTGMFHCMDRGFAACCRDEDAVDGGGETKEGCLGGCIGCIANSKYFTMWSASIAFTLNFHFLVKADDYAGPEWLTWATLVAFGGGLTCMGLAGLLRVCIGCQYSKDSDDARNGSMLIFIIALIDVVIDEGFILACYITHWSTAAFGSSHTTFADIVSIVGALFAVMTAAFNTVDMWRQARDGCAQSGCELLACGCWFCPDCCRGCACLPCCEYRPTFTGRDDDDDEDGSEMQPKAAYNKVNERMQPQVSL